MRFAVFLLLVLLVAACGENASPEGRMSQKIAQVQAQLDSLKKQNALVLDSLGQINANLRKIQQQQEGTPKASP